MCDWPRTLLRSFARSGFAGPTPPPCARSRALPAAPEHRPCICVFLRQHSLTTPNLSAKIMASRTRNPTIPPTIQNHLKHHTPGPDDVEASGLLNWPFDKFGFEDPDVIFGSLHHQYNSVPFAIQDPHAWAADLHEAAHTASTKEEFLSLLETQRDQRFLEIQQAWRSTKANLAGKPMLWKTHPDPGALWMPFLDLARDFSMDSLVSFFASYLAGDLDSHPPNALPFPSAVQAIDSSPAARVAEPPHASLLECPSQPAPTKDLPLATLASRRSNRRRLPKAQCRNDETETAKVWSGVSKASTAKTYRNTGRRRSDRLKQRGKRSARNKLLEQI